MPLATCPECGAEIGRRGDPCTACAQERLTEFLSAGGPQPDPPAHESGRLTEVAAVLSEAPPPAEGTTWRAAFGDEPDPEELRSWRGEKYLAPAPLVLGLLCGLFLLVAALTDLAWPAAAGLGCGALAVVLSLVGLAVLRRSTGLSLAGLAVVLLVAALGVGNAQRAQRARSGCADRLRQVAAAMQLYALDHDGLLPPGASWRTALAAHVHDNMPECPAGGTYTMNPALDGANFREVNPITRTVLLCETGPQGSQATMHFGGGHVAFCDGTVRWVTGGPPRPERAR